MKAANNNNECPICNQGSQDKYRPFCSQRCSEIDLGRWFNGSYVIEGNQTSDGQSTDDDLDQ